MSPNPIESNRIRYSDSRGESQVTSPRDSAAQTNPTPIFILLFFIQGLISHAGEDPGGGGGSWGSGSPPPPCLFLLGGGGGGGAKLHKEEKILHACARMQCILVVNSYLDPLSDILYLPLSCTITTYGIVSTHGFMFYEFPKYKNQALDQMIYRKILRLVSY